MQEFTFTIDQIKEIYRAGIKRGSDESTAYEWGSYAQGHKYDECIESIHYIINDGKNYDDKDYTPWNVIEGWFK